MTGAPSSGLGRLDRLLRPRTIAVIGGGSWAENVIRECRQIGFAGSVRAVHPARAEVAGVAAVRSVADLPEAPDAAFVAVNRDACVGVVADLAARGAGGAICFASGFREAAAETGDGASLQDRLVAAAGEMPVLGPNCYGLLNYLDRVALWPDIHGGVPVARGVALVLQSSNIAINLTMQRRGLPLAYVVTAGNQAQTDVAEIGAALMADTRVTALGLYLEGTDPQRMETLAAAARAAGKPVVAVRTGRSGLARAAALTHTASLAGSHAGADALLERLGIAQLHTLPALLETLKLLHLAGPLPSARIAAMCCSGGEASLIADSAEGTGLTFPPLSAAQAGALRQVLGPKVALANPLDYHTYIWGDRARMAACFRAMLDGDVAIGAVVLDFPRADRCAAPDWDLVVEAAAEARAGADKPMAILSTLSDTMPEVAAKQIADKGLIPLAEFGAGLAAIAAAARLGTRAETPSPPPALRPRPVAGVRTLTEAEAKRRLAEHGLRVPRSERADAPDAAVHAAARIGLPVVVKADGFAHKTDAGMVRIDLRSSDAVMAAAAQMGADGYLIEEMVTGGLAELLVGVLLDPAHGYVLTVAAGGTRTELLRDRAHALIPAGREAVADLLGRLRIAPVLAGWRGAPGVAMEPLLDAVMAVQDFVIANHGEIAEIEINPLICTNAEAVAADALIRLGEPDD